MLSVELGITVALLELDLGVVGGNVFELHSYEWLNFIAAFTSIVLTLRCGLLGPKVRARAEARRRPRLRGERRAFG